MQFISSREIRPHIDLINIVWRKRALDQTSYDLRKEVRITKQEILRENVDWYLQFITLVEYDNFEFTWDLEGFYVYEIK